MKKLIVPFLLTVAILFEFIPTSAQANHAIDVRVGVQVGGGHSQPYYRRPVCPPGQVDRSCFAPVRKTARFFGRALRGAGRFLSDVGAAAADGVRAVGRGIRGIGRALFGRRCCYY